MREGERILACDGRFRMTQEVAAHEGLKMSGQPRADVGRRELRNRAPPEHRPDDRSPLDHDPLIELERVETRGQEGLDGRRKRDGMQLAGHKPVPVALSEMALVDQHPQQFLEEERVTFGRLGDIAVHLVRNVGGPEHLCDELASFLLAERLERDLRRAGVCRGVRTPLLEHVGPS